MAGSVETGEVLKGSHILGVVYHKKRVTHLSA